MTTARTIGGLIPLRAFADHFGIEDPTARRMAREGRIPALVRLGRGYYVPSKVIEAIYAGEPLDRLTAART